MKLTTPDRPRRSRAGIIIVYAAFLMVVVFGFAAFAIDIGYMALTRNELQTAADAAALAGAMRMIDGPDAVKAAAQDIATRNYLGKQSITSSDLTIQLGKYDIVSKAFSATESGSNSVRVVAQSNNRALFFAPIFGHKTFNSNAEAIAIINPRDIAFVIDLSGSMNDDTEPAWATETINSVYGPQGYANVGTTLMTNVYSDYGFGAYPGSSESIGQTLSVSNSNNSYRDLQVDGGPLTKASIATKYRISSSDSSTTRKTKAYSWMMDSQLARLMPKAKPLPNSADSTSYAYWEKYLDYVITSANSLPPNQDSDRISGFNNPNTSNYDNTASNLPSKYQNMVGYQTYVQYLMDWGRDRTPTVDNGTNSDPSLTKTQASVKNTTYCPKVVEATAAGNFTFPPREQPMHAVRRSVIAALKVVEDQNTGLAAAWSDYVSIISFDAIDSYHAPTLNQALTKDYRAAMNATANLQVVGDINASTATENGIILARQHLKPTTAGGAGRTYSNKVMVLLTDGVPNINQSNLATVSAYITAHTSTDYYTSNSNNLPYNSVLMQGAQAKADSVQMFPVGTGLGADYDFLDRAARLNGTAKSGKSPRGTGNPAAYEDALTKIFQDIIKGGHVRLAR